MSGTQAILEKNICGNFVNKRRHHGASVKTPQLVHRSLECNNKNLSCPIWHSEIHSKKCINLLKDI